MRNAIESQARARAIAVFALSALAVTPVPPQGTLGG